MMFVGRENTLLTARRSLIDFVASPCLELGYVSIAEPMGYVYWLKLLSFMPGAPSEDSDFIGLGSGFNVLVF